MTTIDRINILKIFLFIILEKYKENKKDSNEFRSDEECNFVEKIKNKLWLTNWLDFFSFKQMGMSGRNSTLNTTVGMELEKEKRLPMSKMLTFPFALVL